MQVGVSHLALGAFLMAGLAAEAEAEAEADFFLGFFNGNAGKTKGADRLISVELVHLSQSTYHLHREITCH